LTIKDTDKGASSSRPFLLGVDADEHLAFVVCDTIAGDSLWGCGSTPQARCQNRRRGICRRARSFGGYGGGVTPVTISNTEVKPSCADGTAGETLWESRTPPEHTDPFRRKAGGVLGLYGLLRARIHAVRDENASRAVGRLDAGRPLLVTSESVKRTEAPGPRGSRPFHDDHAHARA
jgi:hypothetical protein